MQAFYGRIQLRADGLPAASWEKQSLVSILTPYPMVLAWQSDVAVTRIRCHRKVADSLKRVLQGILEHYGSAEAVRLARMHLYGGCYNFRVIRGTTSTMSTHAYGAGIDLDPDHNPLGEPWREGADMMPRRVIDLFKAEGWKWGGDFQARKDAMHFQATT
jgi:hypothetical protein